MKKFVLVTLLFALVGCVPAFAADAFSVADPGTWLPSLCSSVDCLNNFTVKTGYDIPNQEWTSGGFTDLKQSWYVSPAVGFQKAMFDSTQSAFVDANIVVKAARILTDNVAWFKGAGESSVITAGILKYATFGYSLTYDFSNVSPEHRWRHGPWGGFVIPFGPTTPK